LPVRQAVVIAAGCLGLAVAIWLVPASVHVVDWPASGPVRVALFASRARLIALITAALGLCAWAVIRGRRDERLQRMSRIASLASLLWLWTIPYWPWLPERIPFLLVLAGPARWLVAAVALLGAARAVLPSPAPFNRIRGFVLAASFVLYASFGLLNAARVGPGGDEPHYLIISQSLLADGDLKIENNHRQREYRAFWGGELRPDYLKRGIDGEIYSIHAPGLPTLLLPAYAVFGYFGTVLVMCAVATLTAVAVFDLAQAVAGTRTAVATWAAICLTVPFVPYSWLIFPEMPGALVVAWAALWVSGEDERRLARWIWRGIALAILPWVHTKFVIFIALFGAALVWRARKQAKAVAVFLAPIALSLGGWLGFFYAFYGTVNPEAPYGDYTTMFVVAKNIPRGLLGLMFDQKFGLLFYSPVYVFAIAGCWILLRRADTRMLGAVLMLVTAAHVGSTTRLYMWWGGTSAPARFLVPILPALAPMLAAGIGAARGRLGRTVFASTLIVGVLVAATGAVWPERFWLFSDSRGYARLLETIQAGAPLTFTLPTFTFEDWVSPVRPLLAWAFAAAIGMGAMAVLARWARPGAEWLAATGAIALLAGASLTAGRVGAESRAEIARRGALDLLWQYDGDRVRAFDYGALARIDETRLRDAATIRFRAYPPASFALPEGEYEARVSFRSALERQGEIAVASNGRVTFGRAAGILANPAVVPFRLPVTASRMSVTVADENLAASVVGVDIVPTVMTPVHSREPVSIRRIEAIADRPGAYLIYVDDQEYPEDGVYWTRGVERSRVLIAPGPYSRITLTLHLGPRAGSVLLETAGKQQSVMVEANGSAEVQIEVPHDLRLVPVTIQSPTSFRPSEVDRNSDDSRLLGSQVRVRVD
jgi:hypothetical protein